MSEIYIGTKFHTKRQDGLTSHPDINELKHWGKIFAQLDMCPDGGEGNLSLRTKIGFIVTGSGTKLANLQTKDFVEVLEVNKQTKTIHAYGKKEPSSESFLHYAIYQQRPEINAIFHTHDEIILKNQNTLNIPSTAIEQPYGSFALVEEVLRLSSEHEYLIIKNHGILSIGNSIEHAGQQIVDKHKI